MDKIVNNLEYAYDTVLLAENPAGLQELIKETNMKNKEYGLDINIKKTKILIISKENLHNLPVNINVDGIDLEVVKDYS
jgi:hypothetical protein